MSPEVAEVYRDMLEQAQAEMADAETEAERQAFANVVVTCQLRLAGVP